MKINWEKKWTLVTSQLNKSQALMIFMKRITLRASSSATSRIIVLPSWAGSHSTVKTGCTQSLVPFSQTMSSSFAQLCSKLWTKISWRKRIQMLLKTKTTWDIFCRSGRTKVSWFSSAEWNNKSEAGACRTTSFFSSRLWITLWRFSRWNVVTWNKRA